MAAGAADNCEAIRAQIEAKFKAGGVVDFTVSTADAALTSGRRVVGSCGNGTKRIVFVPGAAVVQAPRAADKPIVTECRDGSVSTTGHCRK
jgi:hypothetical protein